MPIVASAPGKLVLLGEYAVLEGAPALVLAVDRRARVTLAPGAGDHWQIASPTLALEARVRASEGKLTWTDDAPGELAWVGGMLAHASGARDLPPCRVELDSDAFYTRHGRERVKLGLGSSAALAVALLGALHEYARLPPPSLDDGIRAHRAIQHGRGSGIDVAASFAGGLSRFQLTPGGPRTARATLPEGLHWCCVYSGRPASTGAMLAGVRAWRDREPAEFESHMHELATISSRGIDAAAVNDAAGLLSTFHDYAGALSRFGDAAGVDICSRAHREIEALAASCGCTYKSCGAGGGDVGITCGVENSRLRAFSAHAARAGYPVIGLKADPEGLEITSSD